MYQRAGKVSCLLALLLVISAVFSGCQGKPLPSGMEEEVLLKHGREVAVQLAGGRFEEVLAGMRDDVAAGVTVEDLQALVVQQTEGAGVYKEIDSTMVTGQSAQGEDFGVAVIYCKYSKDSVLFRLAFDPNYELIGLEVKKQ